MTEPLDRQAVHDEMDRARATFHQLLNGASSSSLHRRSSGTRWTNEQLLFHMLFGYLIVRALLVLVRSLGRLPDGVSRVFARILNSAAGPFHMVNYLGSCGGRLVFRGPRVAASSTGSSRLCTVTWTPRRSRHYAVECTSLPVGTPSSRTR
jgi:hypothetical protein